MPTSKFTVPHISRKDLARIFAKIKIDPTIVFSGTPCWLWTAHTVNGYGQIKWQGKNVLVHRLLFAWLVGPLPKTKLGRHEPELDHLCKRYGCGNPIHNELVSRLENIRRSNSPPELNSRKTHCFQGHEFTSNNTRLTPQGARVCIECDRIRGREKSKRRSADPVLRARAAAIALASYHRRKQNVV